MDDQMEVYTVWQVVLKPFQIIKIPPLRRGKDTPFNTHIPTKRCVPSLSMLNFRLCDVNSQKPTLGGQKTSQLSQLI